MTTLRDEIRQNAPFTSLQQEAALNVMRTANQLVAEVEQLLKPHGLGITQYNVLRILRGSESDGLCRNDLRSRMLSRMPDMTRLLDRMEQAGLVERERGEADRRVVHTRITPEGLRLINELDEPMAELHRRQLSHLSEPQLQTLVELLTVVRRPG